MQGILGSIICHLWLTGVVYNTSSVVSTYLLAAFTVEVFVSIVYPIQHKKLFSHRLVALIVVVCWFLSLAIQLGSSLIINEVVNGYCFIGYNWAKIKVSNSVFNLILKIVIPTNCYIICNILIIRALKYKAAVETSASHNSKIILTKASEDRYLKARANAVIVLMYTVMLHIITWTGYQILVLLAAFGYTFLTTDLVAQILLLATYIGGCINPVIYVIRYEKFRQAVRNFVHCNSTNPSK